MWQGKKRKNPPPNPMDVLMKYHVLLECRGRKSSVRGRGYYTCIKRQSVGVETTWFNHSLRALRLLTSKTIVDPEILSVSCSQDQFL